MIDRLVEFRGRGRQRYLVRDRDIATLEPIEESAVRTAYYDGAGSVIDYNVENDIQKIVTRYILGTVQTDEAMRAEARKICTEPVKESEVQRVKNLRRTSLATEAESPYHRLVQIMHDVDYHGVPRTVVQRLAAVDAVTVDSVAELFQRYPIDRNGYSISVGPRNWPEA